MLTLKTGDLAFLDTIASGLVPVKVQAIRGGRIHFRVTGARYAYPRGYNGEASYQMIVPRGSVLNLRSRSRQPIILSNWRTVED